MENPNVQYYQLGNMKTTHILRGEVESSNCLANVEKIKKVHRYYKGKEMLNQVHKWR